jgi:serine/threonine protein kinase
MAEPDPKKRNALFRLAAEGVVPVVGGCAGALAAGPQGGLVGVAIGQAVEKAINLFGRGIVERWQAWFVRHKDEAPAAVAALAELSPAEAREQARSILLDLAPDADAQDISLAIEFLSAIPRAVDRALVPDPAGPGRSVPPTVSFEDARSLLQLLPEDVPPYPASADLPNSPYQLVELLGSGGFGAVYRAVSPTLQHLPLAIKFCLDRALLPALNQERSNLERLMRAGGRGSNHVVRLYGYDLDHPTPYLVYEYVPGGDLTRLVAARKAALGRSPDPAEVLGWVVQIAEGLAFAHRTGLVHRDLKPANILIDGDTLRLADFGLGGVAAARAAVRSRIGTSTVDYLSLADQASLFRGAGTPLYMSPEQRRGAPPDPRHDLYALGVVWYQMLVGDVSRELHHGWAKELVVRFGVPASHIGLIERCVGWFDERPKDADELLPLLKEAISSSAGLASPGLASPERERGETPPDLPSLTLGARQEPPTVTGAAAVTPTPQTTTGLRRTLLESMVKKLAAAYTEADDMRRWRAGSTIRWGLLFGLVIGWVVGDVIHAMGVPQDPFPASFRGTIRAPSIAGGIIAGLGVWFLYVFITRSGVYAVREDVEKRTARLTKELAAEFPAEVAGWGGPAVLRDPALVRQIRDELNPHVRELIEWKKKIPPAARQTRDEPTPPPSSPTSTLTPDEVTADPTRKAILIARLWEHARLLKATKDNTAGAWGGLFALWFTLVPMIGAGVFGALRHGVGIDPLASGIVVGVVVLVGGLAAWAGMARARRAVAQKREAGIARLAADYPKLVEAWGGVGVLESPEAIAALLRTYDPSIPTGKAGYLRWLLGG